jgi:hypothetical protein
MYRTCSYCQKSFTPGELSRDETHAMEADREAAGLYGVAFRCYRCSSCGWATFFADIHRVPREPATAFLRRRDELVEAVQSLQGERANAVLVERPQVPRPRSHALAGG